MSLEGQTEADKLRVLALVRNKELEFVNSAVFLGITLDNRLQLGPHIQHPSVEERRQMHAEMELMKNVGHHPNVVSLVGCCTGGRPMLLVEFCNRGDLLNYLRRSWAGIIRWLPISRTVVLPSLTAFFHLSSHSAALQRLAASSSRLSRPVVTMRMLAAVGYPVVCEEAHCVTPYQRPSSYLRALPLCTVRSSSRILGSAVLLLVEAWLSGHYGICIVAVHGEEGT
ncbi:Tyrosine-protein kinase receptor torso [Eumeta japonica]|uniref:Tyrosine-protein kinase receptor torso n=1 Tax=Eumeta variegata TaxID=151549 RepID=A0A4C1UMQ2_EUMVA|nr:Tyrosine-protein kinase receptor torso [Eumeta japonica]